MRSNAATHHLFCQTLQNVPQNGLTPQEVMPIPRHVLWQYPFGREEGECGSTSAIDNKIASESQLMYPGWLPFRHCVTIFCLIVN